MTDTKNHIHLCCNGALFVEASQTPNMIDHNILWDIRGTGIYAGDTDNLIIAHNLIGPCTGPGVHTRVATDRRLNGRLLTSKGNRVTQNIFCTPEPIRFEDKENTSENNVFANSSGRFDLAKWQQSGQDANSVRADLDIHFSEVTVIFGDMPVLPRFKAVPGVNVDYRDLPRSAGTAIPGPFEPQPEGVVYVNWQPLPVRN